MTHPSFISIPSTGFWVGKFETGYKKAETKEIAQSNTYNISKIEIKPNVYSWRGIQVANAHLNSFNYERNLDSHMMKNTEWGAVAYLTYSKYGINSKMRVNNSSDYKTGNVANIEMTCSNLTVGANDSLCNIYCSDNTCNDKYNSPTGYLGSTTGNVYGIYDMSGGAWEYTMSFFTDDNNALYIGVDNLRNSGFNGKYGNINAFNDNDKSLQLNTGIDLPDSKYYDTYHSSRVTWQQYYISFLGDFIKESGPFANKTYANSSSTQTITINSWHEAYSAIGVNFYPVIMRGTSFSYGVTSDISAFTQWFGNAENNVSYRIVLSITK